MACKRSGVRIPIAPPQVERRPNPAGPLKTNGLAGVVAAVSPRLAWAFGAYTGTGLFPEPQALIRHWNGTSWKRIPSP